MSGGWSPNTTYRANEGRRMKLESPTAKVDFEKFRLRRFVDQLIEAGEVEVISKPVDLADVSAIVEATPKAVLFKKAGPEQVELVVGVMGSRRRMAMALGTDDKGAREEFLRRSETSQPMFEVSG